jgi:hypothetical protein
VILRIFKSINAKIAAAVIKKGPISISWYILLLLLSAVSWIFWASKMFWEFVEYIGAAIVTLGVIGEYLKEFKEFPKDEMKRRRFAEWSVVVLIFGLVIELFGLVRTSQITGLEIASLELTNTTLQAQIVQTSTNVEKNAPQNRPIALIFAHAEFEVRGTVQELKWYSPDGTPSRHMELDLYRKNERLSVIHLEAENPLRGDNGVDTWYWVDFHMGSTSPLWNTESKTVEQTKDLDLLTISANFFPVNSEIIKGTAAVTINLEKKEYIIPPQKTANILGVIYGYAEPDKTK